MTFKETMLALLLSLALLNCQAQEEREPEPGPAWVAEQMPVFPGGEKSLGLFLTMGLGRDEGVRIPVSFVVRNDGSVYGATCLLDEDDSRRAHCGRAVARAMSMPKWSPARQDGRVVPVLMTAVLKLPE